MTVRFPPAYPRCVDRALARLRTNRVDAALAAAFTLAGLAQVLLFPIAARWLGVLFVIGTTLPLAWRRTFPVEAAVASSVLWLVPTDGFPIFGFVVAILQFYALGCYGQPRTAVALAAGWSATAGAVGTLLGPEAPVEAIGAVLVVVAPVFVGQVVARLREQNARLARLSEDLRIERRKVEEAAVGAERARIAQELHDVVGHEVTLIAIQAEAASVALRISPSRAAEPVEAIRVTAHRTLDEIRGVLDVLAPDHRSATEEDLAGLARRAEAAGIASSLVVRGEPWPEQSPASMAVNRIVRECLTNAGRHAPGKRVTLTVAWSPDEVRVQSTNEMAGVNGHAVEAGRGLTGIRHRAELLGGTFAAAADDGRFDVRVSLPAPAHHGATP